MIADLAFPAGGGVRSPRFVARTSIPLSAACLVANGVREILRELLREPCEVALGEPAPLDAASWAALCAGAYGFVTPGRQTDIVLVIAASDARRIVRHAFGERAGDETACSALERQAMERIAARCSAAFDPLCAERRGVARAVEPDALPACVAAFDLRVRAPVVATLGIGIVRDLPDPGPTGRVAAAALDDVALTLRATLAGGTIDAAAFVGLRPGDVVRLDTQVGYPGSLKLGGQTIASGTCGSRASRAAFQVHEIRTRGTAP